MNGFVKINRSIVDWEWYRQPFTRIVFEHLIYTANWQDNRWQGIEVKRGQIITSVKAISIANGIKSQSVRTALKRLISTGEITIKTTNKYTIITICKYDDYQILEDDSNKQTNKQPNKQVTNKQQTTNKQLTTNEEDNNIRIQEEKEDISKTPTPLKKGGAFKPDLSFIDNSLDEWAELIQVWLDYKQARREAYKSQKSIEALYYKLHQLSAGNFDIAREIVAQSMSNNWAGIFALKSTTSEVPQQRLSDEEFDKRMAMFQQTFGTRPI